MLLVGAGLWHGRATGRWTPSNALEVVSQRLGQLPAKAGDWIGKPLPVEDEEQFARAGVKAFQQYRYTHRVTGATATVLVVCGKPGPISVHDPTTCYVGAGYVMNAKPRRLDFTAGGQAHQLWMARFDPPGIDPGQKLEILWGWNSGEGWQAPEMTRWEFAGKPYLFKLYILSDAFATSGPIRASAATELAPVLMPALNGLLLPSAR